MAFPLKPPREWFSIPEASKPTPLTFEASGRVYGHLAPWDACHRGFMNGTYSECVQAPRSATEYAQFHLGNIETDEGDMIPIGKITYDTDHAPLTANLQAASKHYDNTGSVGAFVRARDGHHGIWLSGAVRSDITEEGFRDLRANPGSGDWRALNRNLELVAALAVVTPGFAITRSQLALAASANGELEVSALILAGFAGEEEVEERPRRYVLKRKALAAAISEELDVPLTAAVLTAKKRKSLPRSAFAIPAQRAYPIHDEAHARNALARAAGKPEEMRVRRAVCRRYPSMCKS